MEGRLARKMGSTVIRLMFGILYKFLIFGTRETETFTELICSLRTVNTLRRLLFCAYDRSNSRRCVTQHTSCLLFRMLGHVVLIFVGLSAAARVAHGDRCYASECRTDEPSDFRRQSVSQSAVGFDKRHGSPFAGGVAKEAKKVKAGWASRRRRRPPPASVSVSAAQRRHGRSNDGDCRWRVDGHSRRTTVRAISPSGDDVSACGSVISSALFNRHHDTPPSWVRFPLDRSGARDIRRGASAWCLRRFAR